MASGLEPVASAFGIVSLAVQLFQGCIEGYKICNSARNIGRDGDLLYTKLAVQRSRLEAWAYKAGLPFGPFKRLNWDPILLILGQQQALLRSAKEVQDRYGLNGGDERHMAQEIVERPEGSNDGHAAPTDTAGLVERLRPLFVGTTSLRQAEVDNIRQRNNVVRRFSWAVIDKSKLKHIVSEITTLNSQLVEYLNDADQAEFRREVGTLYRALVSECKASNEVENIRQSMPPDVPKAIVAAAHVKKWRLALNFDKRDDEATPIPSEQALTISSDDFKHFRAEKLVIGMETQYLGMRIASYHQSVVMVEWRTITTNWIPVHRSLRDLAVLLHQADDCAFHSLSCAGYVDMQELGRFGFVYDITEFATGGDPTSVQSQSLFDLFLQCSFVSVVDRMRIAYDIAEAVMQLHTAGWLHKGICSENVRFVAHSRADARTVIRSNPQLVGYGYARPDTASAAVMTELPVTATNRDLYRHPNARGESRQTFNTRFDMYGLACLLVELALWRRLEDVLPRYHSWTAQQATPSLNDLMETAGFQAELAFHVGPRFIKAIRLCLDSPESRNEGCKVQASVLDALGSCKADFGS